MCNLALKQDGSHVSGHATLFTEINTYIFYKKTIFQDKQLSLL